MSLKAKIEAIIYAAEEPVTAEQILSILKDELEAEVQSATASAQQDELPPEPDEPAAEAEPAEGEAKPRGKKKDAAPENKAAKAKLRALLQELVDDYANAAGRGMEIRLVAGGYRMSTKPEHHDAVRAFARSLKPPVRLSLPALETLAVIAYKQPITAPEISEIRGVDSSGVLATLLDRKLITTAGRKQVVGRPILYKTTKEFLLRFGLKDVGELPSMEEFEKLTAQSDLFEAEQPPSGEQSAEAEPASDMQGDEDGEEAHAFDSPPDEGSR